jgi:uncharacterized protein YndB with AHSA1/START domain
MMASIIMETLVGATAASVWEALSNVGEAHRIFSGVLSDCRLEGENVRIATFANGNVIRERIISAEDEHMRVAYTVTGGNFEHHNASMQIIPQDGDTCRFVWVCDVLPNAAADRIRPLMSAGMVALKRSFATR